MKLAFVFVVIGFGTKAGLAPLHMWLPDAHSQAPSPISAMLSGVLLKCGLYGILRFYPIASSAVSTEFASGLLLGFGLLSVAVAVPFILVQRDIKRLLAYSSVEHIGLVAIAVGIGGPLAIFAGVLHALNHAVAKTLLFFVAGDVAQRYGTTRIGRIRGLYSASPAIGTLLLVGVFAITGLPPFAIFVTEFGIISAGFVTGHWAASAVVIVALSAIFAGMLRHALKMTVGTPDGAVAPVRLSRLSWLALAIPAIIALALGVYVPPALSSVVAQVTALLQS
jgi:hydrogenase-4 component F